MLDYGIIGNCKACALINKRAGVEWFCFPDFSSPSVFAKILDREKGGSFEISTKGRYRTSQKYIEETNILETYFESEKASFVVIDFFPRYRKIIPNRKRKIFLQNKFVRIIKPLKGNPVIRIKYDPKLDYARDENEHKILNNSIITTNKNSEICLISNVNYYDILNEKNIKLDGTKYFFIGDTDNSEDFNVKKCAKLLSATKKYWKKWVSSLVLTEKNKDLIIRSALLLKLLTFSETGAVLAGATCSIPEQIGTERNFDYRFCWIRDAAFAVDSLKKIGRDYEAKKLMEFVFENTIKKKQTMQIMYGIHGETNLEEKFLPHLKGFRNSRPVRLGNAAYSQKQNDIYGSIIDIIYLYYVFYEYEKKLPQKMWRFLRYLVNEIRMHWHETDSGIWEFRAKERQLHYTYSKLMCFVGIDRAAKIAQHFDKNVSAQKWISLRDKIRNDILNNAWSDKKKAFTIAYGREELDASVLRMSYHNFLEHDDPRLISTIKKINEELRKGYLVMRYKMIDDFGRPKSAFTICVFWLIDALYNIGEKEEAVKLFDNVMKHSNHLGLFSEGIDEKSGTLRGNFPQAYTHLAIINSSILMSEWSAKRKKLELTGVPAGKRVK